MSLEELPDPIELMEDRAERMADELFKDEIWYCCKCSKPIPLGSEVPSGVDPASPAMCRNCARED